MALDEVKITKKKGSFLQTLWRSSDSGTENASSDAPAASSSVSLSEAELFSQLPQAVPASLFLNRWTPEELRKELESSGLLSSIRKKGFHHLRIDTQHVDPDEHRLLVFEDDAGGSLKLSEFRFELTRREMPKMEGFNPTRSFFNVLNINWVLLQNPRQNFTADRPQLPGQEHPGLGLGWKSQQFLERLGAGLGCDGLENHPQYFHNAVFYCNRYFFVDPVRQGVLLAMMRDLEETPMNVASRAITEGKLMDKIRNAPVMWEAGSMLCPLTRSLKKFFDTRAYKKLRQEAIESHHFGLSL